MLSLFMTACSSDDYDWATVSGNQVYFSNELDTIVEISSKATSFEVPISRVKSDEAISVPLKAEQEDGSIFTVPSNVEFKAGEKVAKVLVSYDPAKITFGKYEKLTLSIADDAYSTDYGYGTYTFKAGATQWTDWAPYNAAGTATFKYSLFWNGDDAGLKFYVRHNTIDTNEYQFRIEQCMYGVNIVMDYDENTGVVSVPVQNTGYHHSKYDEDVMVADFDAYLKSIGKENTDKVYGSFDKEQGIITLPLVYFISQGVFANGYEYIYLDGFDRKDVTCGITYSGKFVDPKNNPSIVANVTLGADVTSAYVAMVPGELTQEIFDQVKAGTYENVQEIKESGEVKFDASTLEDGNYTLVVVSLYNGEAQNYDTASFKYTNSNSAAETWKALYTGVYDYAAASMNEAGNTFYEGKDEVVLYQSEKDPTRYKVAPWATSDNNEGLLFTMDDNGKITIDHCETGEVSEQYGTVWATDLVTLGVMESGKGYDCSYADGVFKFFLAYHVEAGVFSYELNTLTLTGNASARVAHKVSSLKSAKKAHKKSLTMLVRKNITPIFSLK